MPLASRSTRDSVEPLAGLSSLERAIIALGSAFAAPEPKTIVTRGLGKLGLKRDRRSLRNSDVVPLLEDLARRGLLATAEPCAVSPPLSHQVMLQLAQTDRLATLAEVVRDLRPAYDGGTRISTWELAIRELRLELYAEQWDAARALVAALPRYVFADLCSPFDSTWLRRWPADLRSIALAGIVESSLARLEPADEAFAMLEAEPALANPEHRVVVEQLLFRGRFEDAERRLDSHPSLESAVGRAFLLFLRGRLADATSAYESALKRFLKRAGKRAAFFPDRAGFFYAIALIAEGSAASLTRAGTLVSVAARTKHLPFQQSHQLLSELLDVLANRSEPDETIHLTSSLDLGERDPVELLVHGAAILWIGLAAARRPSGLIAELEERLAGAQAAGYHWYTNQIAAVLAGLSAERGARKQQLDRPTDGVCLAALVSRPERWSQALDALIEAAAPKTSSLQVTPSPGPASEQRLVWIVRKTAYRFDLEPREQKRTKGGWSKGRPVALKRLHEQAAEFPFLSEADRTACATITSETTYEYHGRYPRISYSLDRERALVALANGGTVLIEGPTGAFGPCEIRQTAPRLDIVRDDRGLSVALNPRPSDKEERRSCRLVGAHCVEIVEFLPIHHAIAQALGKKPLAIPRAGEGQLRAAIDAISSRVEIHSDLAGDGAAVGAAPGQTRPCFLLRPLGDGLAICARVRPLGAEGPSIAPGRGGTTVVAQVRGQPARAARNLDDEQRRLEAVLTACPVLAAGRSAAAEFVLATCDDALEALAELRALEEDVALEWPDGVSLRVSEPVGIENLRLSISSDKESFLLRGSLALPDEAAIKLTDLMDYLSASPSRFLELPDKGRYVVLKARLRSRLMDLLGLGERVRRGLRVHPLAAPLVADLLAPECIEGDDAWRRQIDRFAATDDEPGVPSTFRGELRPYQHQGFRWLTRLGRWGAGACLADDMGLGKTIQTIALLLQRATHGPSLVVAPTSVVPGWIDEVARFAPTLRVRAFAGPARARQLQDLGPFDLLVTSYNILLSDIDTLEEIPFSTAVLDEAQAIKNLETKRSRAAGRLQAALRVATTGTPIENRLDDLHSLFSFLNPGLLGSPRSFQDRFARPIEQEGDHHARDRLRRLVAPFILRRTKTEVLPELPARTETTLRVPLGLEEMTIYETIRQEAIAALSDQETSTPQNGTGRIRILTMLTRLRLAASNARLVLPDTKAPSAKLAAFGDLLDDLLPNQHKVLVFSQFVGHLALVKEMLDARGVPYQYLDGSTSMGARSTAVEAFQAGQGEVFLISLKAGGLGLNLTAADYVVHMDPWWNPAVEVQASDRAHRIGQSRPVSIYRLVARDTIEDRILALHQRKRELAQGILDGSDLAGKMSEEELLALIREPPTATPAGDAVQSIFSSDALR